MNIKIAKFITIALFAIIPLFFIYNMLFVYRAYENFETTGTITEMEYEEGEWETKEITKKVKQEDGTTKEVKEKIKMYDDAEWDLEIKYTDSDGDEVIYKEEPSEKSDLYKSLESLNLKVGDKVVLLTEECFLNDKLKLIDTFLSRSEVINIIKK